MKTFKFSLVLRTRENTDVFISLDDNIYGIHSKRINILYVLRQARSIKQCTLRADAARCGVWSGSTLYVNRPRVFSGTLMRRNGFVDILG